MKNNFKKVLVTLVIGVVTSTVLLAQDIDSTTYEQTRSGTVQVIPLNSDQIGAFQKERSAYKEALQQLKESHANRIDEIININ